MFKKGDKVRYVHLDNRINNYNEYDDILKLDKVYMFLVKVDG